MTMSVRLYRHTCAFERQDVGNYDIYYYDQLMSTDVQKWLDNEMLRGWTTEVKGRKDRVDDGLHATRAAVEEGVVAGGGVPLARASLVLGKLKADNDDQRFGVEIVRKAVQTPLRQIAENAGEDGAVIAGKILDRDEYNWGYDAQAGEFKDLVKAGIVDPTKVVRTALQDAASVAGLLVTTEAMVADKPERKGPAMPPGAGGMGGMGDMDF